MKKFEVLSYCLITLGLFLIAFCGAKSAKAMNNPYETDTVIYVFDTQEQMDMEKYFSAYCREIDSLVYSYGMEIDADAVDIEDDVQMEQAAYELLGDRFYTWRQKESKYAWIRDVYIARYCY